MSYGKIQAALDAHLLIYQTTHIAFPGAPYRAAHGTAFLEVAFLPAPAKAVLLGADMPLLHSGAYRITVHDPDRVAALATVADLRSLFAPGLELTFEALALHLGVASLGATEKNLKHTSLPLSIQWRSYF